MGAIAFDTIGDCLSASVSEALCDVVVAAPFVKVGALDCLLERLPASKRLVCVTRWRLEDIGIGVSDLDVYGVVREHGGQLWLNQRLHAKALRVDDRLWVGSANVTGAALGWSPYPNLELMLETSADEVGFEKFEKNLFDGAVEVDDQLYESYVRAAQALRTDDWTFQNWAEIEVPGLEAADPQSWLPALRQPVELYRDYLVWSELGNKAELGADSLKDLVALQIPRGLAEPAFRQAVTASLLPMPMLAKIDRFLETPRRFGEVRSMLVDQLGFSRFDATRDWQTTIRWLLYFLPDRYSYERRPYSEVLSRK